MLREKGIGAILRNLLFDFGTNVAPKSLCTTIHSNLRAPRRFCATSSKSLKRCTTIHSNLRAPRRFCATSSKSLKRCGAGWQPAADWQSACRHLSVISQADGCGFAAAALRGRLATCGRLPIGLPAAHTVPEEASVVCGLPPCGAGWQGRPPGPADCQSASSPSRAPVSAARKVPPGAASIP
jgi:hypothetical protein